MPTQADLAILFADVAGSTQLYETLGDAAARDLVGGCVAVMSDVTRRHGGRVVKTIGDEVMAIFPSAHDAIAAAAEMQEGISACQAIPGRRLEIRAGLHFGPVLVEDGDVFGDAVNLASRMANQAKAGQILTTGPTAAAAASSSWRAACRLIDRVGVKGKREPVDVIEVVWKASDATLMRHTPPPARGVDGGARLILSAHGLRAELSEEHPTLTIGRGEQNDIVVAQAIVSRLHARAELRNGRCVLTDQSANGTFVVPDAAPPSFVHRDSMVLTGTGALGLGEVPSALAPTATTLRYEVRAGGALAAA
jgi:adenylate cyclase